MTKTLALWGFKGGCPTHHKYMRLLSSPKLHIQFRLILTTIFTTNDARKFVHDIKKIGVSEGLWGDGGCPPKYVFAFFSETTHTHNFDETWPNPLSTVMYQGFFHGTKKTNPSLFTFFSIMYFMGHPWRPVVAWLSYPATTRWAPRGTAPMFNISVRSFVIIPGGPTVTGTTLAFFSFLDLLTSFLRS